VSSPGAQSDLTIRNQLLAGLKQQPWAPSATVDVVVHDGVVDLWGTIMDERQREALHVMAENIAGVIEVQDHLAWIEPLSGIVIEPEQAPAQRRQAPVVAAWPRH
jgi:osmotically-inducible protein OsmY